MANQNSIISGSAMAVLLGVVLVIGGALSALANEVKFFLIIIGVISFACGVILSRG